MVAGPTAHPDHNSTTQLAQMAPQNAGGVSDADSQITVVERRTFVRHAQPNESLGRATIRKENDELRSQFERMSLDRDCLIANRQGFNAEASALMNHCEQLYETLLQSSHTAMSKERSMAFAATQ